MSKAEQPGKLQKIASAMIFFGLVAFVGSDYIALGGAQLGLAGFIPEWAAYLAVLAPVGVLINVYVRRTQIIEFLSQLKKGGLTKTLTDLADKREREDFQKIGDPLAQKIPWSAIRRNAPVLPMRVRLIAPGILTVGHGQWPVFAGAAVVVAAILIALLPFWSLVVSIPDGLVAAELVALFQDAPVFLIVPAALVAIAGSIPLLTRYQTIVIDKSRGTLTRSPTRFTVRRINERSAELGDIHAVQIVRFIKSSGSENASRIAYEIILVRKNGARLWLMNSADPDAVQRNAQRIADFLGVSVWSRTHGIYDYEAEQLKKLDMQ
jgi:uncharacterized membrane protein